jgi:hypothetical protein
LANDELGKVHILDHVLERANIGIGHLAAFGDVTQRFEVLEDVIGQLVLRGLHDYALKVLWLDVSITILVKLLEGLPNSLTLKTAKHLGELLVVQIVALLLTSYIELGPLAVPVERDAVWSLIELIELPEIVVLHSVEAVDVEQPEGNIILGIGLLENVLEVGPVREGNSALADSIGNLEQYRILFTLDLVLFARARVSESSF